MTMLGTAVPTPSAVADVMALLRLIADPKGAKANLDALMALGEELTAKAADLDAREQAVAVATAANAAAVAKLEADGKTLEAARDEQARGFEGLRLQKQALIEAKADHAADVAVNVSRTKALDQRGGELDAAKSDMEKRAADIATEQHARSLELNARAEAVEKAESAFAEKQARLAQALQGASL